MQANTEELAFSTSFFNAMTDRSGELQVVFPV